MKRFFMKYLMMILFMAVFGCLNRQGYGFTKKSYPEDNIPNGKLTKHVWDSSKIYPGTIRDYWVYVPAQYDKTKPACVMIFQDGHAYVDEEGPVYIPGVFDNLIHKKEMPVTIAILVNPGTKDGKSQRRIEYTTMDDTYARFLLEEILPEVEKKYNLVSDAAGRGICGSSAGGICSFTAAWERPDAFLKVISFIGGYAEVPGSGDYPSLIRKTRENPKPIRILLQTTENDLNHMMGDFKLGNLDMESALEFAGYDYLFELGPGGHDLEHAGSILPDILRWLWRDYPGVKTVKKTIHEDEKKRESTISDDVIYIPSLEGKTFKTGSGKENYTCNFQSYGKVFISGGKAGDGLEAEYQQKGTHFYIWTSDWILYGQYDENKFTIGEKEDSEDQKYQLTGDSLPREGIPKGAVSKFSWNHSQIYPETKRDYWTYVPAQYDPAEPACLMLFFDGEWYKDQVPVVFDNLIHKKAMPVTICIFVNPGEFSEPQIELDRSEGGAPPVTGKTMTTKDNKTVYSWKFGENNQVWISGGKTAKGSSGKYSQEGQWVRMWVWGSEFWAKYDGQTFKLFDSEQRSGEYDSLGDKNARFILDEIIHEVAKEYNIIKDPAGRAVAGFSSGGKAAFTVAWERPDQFSKVLTYCASYTDILGAHIYPNLIRKTRGDPKPIRIFLQTGEHDLNITEGNWKIGNLKMESALKFARYDYQFVMGTGGHETQHGMSIFPETLRWLWRDYPGVKYTGPINSSPETAYYIDSVNGSDDNSGTSKNSPWQSLAIVSDMTFQPGDNIYFKRGSSYSGCFTIKGDGTASKAITISAYGDGNAPSFTNLDFYDSYGTSFFINGDYIIIDGLYFHGGADAQQGSADDALRVGAVFINVGSDHVTVKNCEFYDCMIGVNSVGLYAQINNNNFHNFNRWLWKPNWGPMGVVIGNAYADVSYNYFTDIYKVGGAYGADGGAIEIDDRFFGQSVHDVNIHHNVSRRCYGFLEVETECTGSNIDVYYNVSYDYQEFIFYWGGHDSKVENNTVIRTLPPLGNPSSVNTVFSMAYNWGEVPNRDPFTVRNNIFVVGNGLQVWVDAPYDANNGYAFAVKENNIYYSADGSTSDPHGLTLGPGEMIVNPGFVNLFGKDYHLTSGSSAIDAGQMLGYTSDFEGRTVPNGSAPDIGAYELQYE
jgi:enterochelin esterase family protein